MKPQQPKKLLRLQLVLEKTGLSRTALYTDKTFPKPIKIGPRASAWLEAEIDSWIDERILSRQSGSVLSPQDQAELNRLVLRFEPHLERELHQYGDRELLALLDRLRAQAVTSTETA